VLREGDNIEILIAASGGAVSEIFADALTSDEVRRYARHLALPGVGRAGQSRLKAARSVFDSSWCSPAAANA
jgi:adenylyltransferase/sulfurtransferase